MDIFLQSVQISYKLDTIIFLFNHSAMAYLHLILTIWAILPTYFALIQVAPTWNTSEYVLAGSNSIINGTSTTGSGTTPTATLPFSRAFASVPNLAYGLSHYESSDNLGEEMFEVNRTALTTSSFSVKVQISGNTDIWIIVVRYIAVSKLFPHHLNSFDNVPVNYNNGPLTAFSSRTMSLIHYSNTINYTLQANSIGSVYKNFTAPYTNIKILLFMTSMFFDGSEPSGSYAPIDIIVDANAISVDLYQINVTFGSNALCSRLHYSMIIFDQADVERSRQYYLVCLRVNLPTAGGDVELPFQFVTNAIMGWTDFSSFRTETLIKFYLNFQNLTNGSYGVHMPASVPRSSTKTPITRFGFTLFYLKTWICPNSTYFNLTTNLCVQCTIANCTQCINQTHCNSCQPNFFLTNSTCSACSLPNCLTCLNLTFCQTCNSTASYSQINGSCSYCDPSLNTFINSTSLSCQPCSLQHCLNCSSLTQCSVCDESQGYFLNGTGYCVECGIQGCLLCGNLTYCDQCGAGFVVNGSGLCEECGVEGCLNCTQVGVCHQCNMNLSYSLLPNGTCEQCQVSLNYFLNLTTDICQLCSLNECLNCSSLYQCLACNTSNSYYLSPTNNTCQYCDPTLNTFLNSTSLQCQPCSLPFCLNCSSLLECTECNTSSNYFLNLSTNQCQPCNLSNCLQCASFTVCEVCDESNQYFLNVSSGICEECGLEGCLNCTGLGVCGDCDEVGGYSTDYSSFNYSLCSNYCNVTCNCGGYDLPWVDATASCTPICGDGIILLTQGCDDNNTDPGDGCSGLCQIESSYTCIGQPSNCTQNLIPPPPSPPPLPPTIPFQPQQLTIQKQSCNSFLLKISKQSLPTQQISILNPGISILNITSDSQTVYVHAQYTRDIVNEEILVTLDGGLARVLYQPLVPCLYYSEQECRAQEDVKRLVVGVQVMSYVVLLGSIFSCKIVGLELFGALQLSYFTLADHTFFNSYLAPLTSFKSLNGLNLNLIPQSSQVPKPQKQMGISSTFLNNCNIMFLASALELVISGSIYLVAKISNSQKLYRFSLNLLKQGFITLILFNSFNFSFSAAVHIKYANHDDQYYGVSTFLMVLALVMMLLATILMEFTSSQTYGEFKNKYKENWICRLFIPVSLLYRMALGFYIALKTEQQESTLVILSVVILFMLYLLTNLPYNDTYQNYRSVFVHVTMVVTLFTTNYYRSMKSNTPLEIKARIHGPAILELGLIVFCVVVSLLAVAYELYLAIKECRDQGKNKVRITNQKTEESDMDVDTRGRKASTDESLTLT